MVLFGTIWRWIFVAVFVRVKDEFRTSWQFLRKPVHQGMILPIVCFSKLHVCEINSYKFHLQPLLHYLLVLSRWRAFFLTISMIQRMNSLANQHPGCVYTSSIGSRISFINYMGVFCQMCKTLPNPHGNARMLDAFSLSAVFLEQFQDTHGLKNTYLRYIKIMKIHHILINLHDCSIFSAKGQYGGLHNPLIKGILSWGKKTCHWLGLHLKFPWTRHSFSVETTGSTDKSEDWMNQKNVPSLKLTWHRTRFG